MEAINYTFSKRYTKTKQKSKKNFSKSSQKQNKNQKNTFSKG
tara:strand:- start:31067 stop:31192 length:126 start_codon:yes stop_codon:yes gene_type:complete